VANEFVKRCDEAEAAADDDEYIVPMVLVAHNCKDIPSREFELNALCHKKNNVSKLWYVLTKGQDLFIIKCSFSGTTHAEIVGELAGCVRNFGGQFLGIR
jgi:hypothetical protein